MKFNLVAWPQSGELRNGGNIMFWRFVIFAWFAFEAFSWFHVFAF